MKSYGNFVGKMTASLSASFAPSNPATSSQVTLLSSGLIIVSFIYSSNLPFSFSSSSSPPPELVIFFLGASLYSLISSAHFSVSSNFYQYDFFKVSLCFSSKIGWTELTFIQKTHVLRSSEILMVSVVPIFRFFKFYCFIQTFCVLSSKFYWVWHFSKIQ